MKVANSNQMREMDRLAIEELGIAGIVLMENASRAVSECCMKHLLGVENPKAVVVCGSGNNGGDGFAVARLLHCHGVEVFVLSLAKNEKLKGDAETNYKIIKNMGIKIVENIEAFDKYIDCANVIVDGIFGTGFSGEARSPAKEVIAKINKSGKKIISIDIPSGVDADNGHVVLDAVRATETVTFALYKIGNIQYPGAEYNGKITIANISIPQEIGEKIGIKGNILDESMAKEWLPKRSARSNKGTFGKLYVIAGSEEMTGAGALCCKAGYKSGCGVVYSCTPKKCGDTMHILVPEAVVKPLESYDGKLYLSSFDEIEEDLKKASAVVIGPGLGRGKDVSTFIEKVLLEAEATVLIDADGLNGISTKKGILKKMKKIPIITPHPGEFSTLAKKEVSEILKDTITSAVEFAKKYNAVVVLKDARTIVASPSGQYFINTTGNNAMAKGGSGDVLSGIIGGFVAQGMESFKAAVLGVYIHGKCGDMAAVKMGYHGVLAGDILNFVPYAIKNIE